VKFGLKLHHSGPGASPDHMLRWARFAETLGMHLLMTADHVALTPDVLPQYPAPYYEPFTNLAWLAGHTDKIMLGTTVIVVPYRHPLLLAQITANIDQLSNGRLIFGIGAGWSVSEYEAFGIPHNKRGAITDDYLAAVKALWTQDVASHDGPYAKFRDVMLSPKPVQKPHPPIWVGGSGYLRGKMPAMDRAVRFGDAWHLLGIRADWLRDEAMPQLRRIAEEAGKPTPALCPRIFCRITDSPLPEDDRVAGEGTLDQIRADLDILEELGAEYVLLDTKRNNETANTARHHEDAWSVVTTLAEKAIDLENETLR
jgi:probable F420-dependent oxidoreductase|tara:strand:- start:5653 stop:6591 length:939 start_codon:yes stop_codon:yes gene_type:complete